MIRTTCKCGCDEIVNAGKQFICGHNFRVMSEESENKRVQSLTGQKFSNERRRNLSLARMGHKVSKETRKKISMAHIGIGHSDETKALISEKKKGCFGAFTGKNHTAKTKEQISKNRKGKCLGKDNPFWGKKHTEEVRKKIGEVSKGRICTPEQINKMSGPNNGNWKGGISIKDPYCSAWFDLEYKESIKERDGYKCQNPNCWNLYSNISLNVHHIDYIKKNCHPHNLITVCHSCNSRANGNRSYWQELYAPIAIMASKGGG